MASNVCQAVAVGLVRQGLPIGGQMLAEFGAFAAMSLIAGRGGTTAVGPDQNSLDTSFNTSANPGFLCNMPPASF